VLRRVGQAPALEPVSESFPFTCDDKKNTICYHGTPLQTSRYEYRILKILIDHPGWVYSREQLMEMAWDEPDMSLLRTVDAHIKNLRRKLKEITPDCDPIVTHRGTGYAIKEDW
jgi:two-component system catabolic regulation response regulator CreB